MASEDQEELLVGNVGGAVRIGQTVHRPTGPWTPAVHALLEHVADRVPHVPRVLGFDEQSREVLTYLPGRVVDQSAEALTAAQIVSVVRWTRAFHDAVADFSHPGPWRYFPIPDPTLIGHNDIAPYNACFDGDELAGVFDWDLAGPTTPLAELAFIAWNCVPLWADVGAERAAERLELIAATYGTHRARDVLHAVPARIEVMLTGIPRAAAAGDAGMANLVRLGEPDRSRRSLDGLVQRIPAIDRHLDRGSRDADADVAMVLASYAAFAAGDIDAAVAPLHHDVEWVEPDEFPDGGRKHGPAEVAEYLRRSRASWSELMSEPTAERHGGRIVVRHHVHGQLLDGTPLEVTVADVYTVEDGRVVRMQAYADPRDAGALDPEQG